MNLDPAPQAFVESARVARLATADAAGRPQVVPVCFALREDRVVSAIDEKPKSGDPADLRRVTDVTENPAVALVVDRYGPDWSRLAWVQLRGTAALLDPGDRSHAEAVDALQGKYDQYADHDLSSRPVLSIDVGHAVAWGNFEDPGDTRPRD